MNGKREKGNNRRLDRLEKMLNLRERGAEKPLEQQISELVRDGIKIGMKLAKVKNGTDEKENESKEEEEIGIDLFSPRFLSITERKADEKVKFTD